MSLNPGFRTPRARVRGLGAAKEGTHHFWQQRLTAVAMIPLTILFVIPFAGALGSGYEHARELYSGPWHALIAVLFIGVGFRHLALGLRVVIEDYVPHHGWRTGLLIANTMFCFVFSLAGIFAVAKIALAG
jgi:succinate dehydrogenase / fumarate reductase membrane anchor subunit